MIIFDVVIVVLIGFQFFEKVTTVRHNWRRRVCNTKATFRDDITILLLIYNWVDEVDQCCLWM